MTSPISAAKRYFIVIGAVLTVLLVAACGSDGSTASNGGNVANLLGASGEEGAQLLRALAGGFDSANNGIRISGRGEASAAPDLAILTIGVEATEATAAEARNQAAGGLSRVVAVLKDRGVADTDMQTSSFNISPRYNSVEVKTCVGEDQEDAADAVTAASQGIPEPQPGEPTAVELKPQETRCFTQFERMLDGYQVNNVLTVKIRDLGEVGPVIDGVTEAAGNLTRVDGIRFSLEDTTALQEQARAAAIADLLDKAGQIAALTGVELGQLITISEATHRSPEPFARAAFASDFAAAAESTPIVGGELDVIITVNGLFGIAGPSAE